MLTKLLQTTHLNMGNLKKFKQRVKHKSNAFLSKCIYSCLYLKCNLHGIDPDELSACFYSHLECF